MMDTRTDLVRRLEELPASVKRDEIIANARAGQYHDFRSDSATPKMDLIRALAALAYHWTDWSMVALVAAITGDVMDGKFDEDTDVTPGAT